MSSVVVPDTEIVKALHTEVAAGGTWEKVTVHLFVNDVNPGRNSALADFTEASFPGYAGSASITWGLPNVPAGGTARVAGDKKEFQATDATTPQIVYGWYGVGVGADSVNVKMAERFDAPANVNGPLDIVIITPQVGITPGGESIIETD
jgi:hypothetical protein